jgi:large subunit ribosomal protein L13
LSTISEIVSSQLVIDGRGHIAGRLASIVSKLLLKHKRVTVVNAENILVSGTRARVRDELLAKLEISSVVHPKHGPFHPRTPSTIFSRTVRGMIPRRKPSGIEALKRLRVYEGQPQQFKNVHLTTFKEAMATRQTSYYVSLAEVAALVGWKGGEES